MKDLLIKDPLKEVLQPYLSVLIEQVFAGNTKEMKALLYKLTEKLNRITSEDISEDTTAVAYVKDTEEIINVIKGYMSVVETTFKTLTQKCSEEMFMDTYHWEHYKQLRQQNLQLQQDNAFLRKQADMWLDMYENEESVNTYRKVG